MSFLHEERDFGGQTLHCVSAGEGPLMLFVHGFPECWLAWRKQLEVFSRDHRAVAADLRGYNLSGKPAEVQAYRSACLVEDLRHLIEHFGGPPATVVAHDWGGAAAWHLAAAYPAYVKRLVIINSPHPAAFARALRSDPAQQAASQYMLWLRRPGVAAKLLENDCARLVAMLEQSTTDARWLTPELLTGYREAWRRPGAMEANLMLYRASPLYPPAPGEPSPPSLDFDPAKSVVRVPTLVIWGERDTALLPCLLDGLEAWVPKLCLKRIPDASHWVIHEKPDEVNRLVAEFLQSTQT